MPKFLRRWGAKNPHPDSGENVYEVIKEARKNGFSAFKSSQGNVHLKLPTRRLTVQGVQRALPFIDRRNLQQRDDYVQVNCDRDEVV